MVASRPASALERVVLTVSTYQRLTLPFLDACRDYGVGDARFCEHAWAFPKAQEMAGRDQAAAQKLGHPTDPSWARRHVLSAALDRCDGWRLVCGRATRLIKDLEVVGQWPTQPFIALGTHWGAGLPTLAHLKESGAQPKFVYRQEPQTIFASRAERWAHGVHLRALEVCGGSITLGGAYAQILESLSVGATPVILVDAPAEGRPTLTGVCGSFTLNVRLGLLNMLCRERLPFVFYRCGFDPQTHRRQLWIGPEALADDPEAIAHQAAEQLRDAFAIDTAQWRLWMVADALLTSTS